MEEQEARHREYEEKLQLESLKRKVSSMKFPAPERKKPKMSFSKSLSGLKPLPVGGKKLFGPEPDPQQTQQIPEQLREKSAAKTVTVPISMSQASKSRIVNKPWKFATKNVAECEICSNDLFSVCHPHISSVGERLAEEGEVFRCSVCKKTHNKEERGKRRVVLGSSTLHNIWNESTYRPDFHVDFDCIIGGQIHDVHAAFLTQYSGETAAMDIVLACGVNNVNTTNTAQDIIFQFRSFVKSIEEQNRDNHVVVASLLYAPKYCDAGVPSSRNMLEKVREVNRWVEDILAGVTLKYVNPWLSPLYLSLLQVDLCLQQRGDRAAAGPGQARGLGGPRPGGGHYAFMN